MAGEISKDLTQRVLLPQEIVDAHNAVSYTHLDVYKRQRLPFETDGSESELMLKLSDGSFIPVLVRAGSVTPPRCV